LRTWLANDLDGVFFEGQAGALEFRTLPPPTDDGVGDALARNDAEIDFVPVSKPDGFHGQVTRINVDL